MPKIQILPRLRAPHAIKRTNSMKFKIIICIVFVFSIASSCKVREIRSKKDIVNIINLVLKDYDSLCLVKETYYSHPTIQPEYAINHYIRVYSYDIMKKVDTVKNKNIAYKTFLKDIHGIITEEELNEMKKRYTSWSLIEWQQSHIENHNVNLISMHENPDNCSSLQTVRVSEPLLSRDMKKALILISSSKNKTGGIALKVLRKENGKWSIKGGIPIGTSQ